MGGGKGDKLKMVCILSAVITRFLVPSEIPMASGRQEWAEVSLPKRKPVAVPQPTVVHQAKGTRCKWEQPPPSMGTDSFDHPQSLPSR